MRLRKFIKKRLSPDSQMSEAFVNSAILAVSGGLMDAYTYNCRGGVFANAETGNIVILGQRLIGKDFSGALKYFLPVCAFAVGIFAAEIFRHRYKNLRRIHWRQCMLLVELAILFIVGLMPDAQNYTANMLVAFSAAVQVQTFRKVDGFTFASTMCTGNLRSGTDALSVYFCERKPGQLKKALEYYAIIIFFALGAGTGSLIAEVLGLHTIWCSCLLLLVSFALMMAEEI